MNDSDTVFVDRSVVENKDSNMQVNEWVNTLNTKKENTFFIFGIQKNKSPYPCKKGSLSKS